MQHTLFRLARVSFQVSTTQMGRELTMLLGALSALSNLTTTAVM